jgi:hypothetical protein
MAQQQQQYTQTAISRSHLDAKPLTPLTPLEQKIQTVTQQPTSPVKGNQQISNIKSKITEQHKNIYGFNTSIPIVPIETPSERANFLRTIKNNVSRMPKLPSTLNLFMELARSGKLFGPKEEEGKGEGEGKGEKQPVPTTTINPVTAAQTSIAQTMVAAQKSPNVSALLNHPLPPVNPGIARFKTASTAVMAAGKFKSGPVRKRAASFHVTPTKLDRPPTDPKLASLT